MNRKRVGMLIFPNVEILDFCGPFEVFSVTRLNEELRQNAPSPFDVNVIAECNEPILTSGGLRVIPDIDIFECPLLDILGVPGGWGTRKEIYNDRLLSWISDRSSEVETLTSVCTGAMLLGKAGLLNGKHTTTHWCSLDWMRRSFPARDSPIEDPALIARILVHLGLPTRAPPRAPAWSLKFFETS